MKGYDELKEFLEGELNNYSFDIGEIRINDEYGCNSMNDLEEYYIVDINKPSDKEKTLRFRYDRKKEELSILMSYDSDNWEMIRDWDYNVKYFWMKLLEDGF